MLFFLFWPSTDAVDLAWLAATAFLANASKYALAWRGRHIFNPAAAGAFLVVVVQELVGRDAPINATWWIAAEKLLPFVAVASFLVLWRTRRLDIGIVFVVVSSVLVLLGLDQSGAPFVEALQTTAYSFPIVFLAGFMLSEPLTLPPRRYQQLVVAAVTALVFAYPMFVVLFTDTPPELGVFAPSPVTALLIGNLTAFGFARRRGLRLELEGRRQLTPETHEFTFRTKGSVNFRPGQYAELTVPHPKADARGTRRVFSISSPPDGAGRVSFALRVPENSSSFKRALLKLEPGHTVRGTGVGGDFLWPDDHSTPLVLVAGGIGITPFLSQLRHHPERDSVLVYGVSSPEEVPFTEELADAQVVLVGPSRPANVPAGWRFVEAPFLTAELIDEAVPDLADRYAYVSGPPAMVNAVRPGLARRAAGIKTDYFTGY